MREHCLAKATPDTGHSTQDWHRLNLDQSHQKVQIAIHHPTLQKMSQLIEIKKKRVDKNIIIFSALKINLATWTASTVSFQEDFAAELIFSPFMGAALARRLITPSPGPTWQKIKSICTYIYALHSPAWQKFKCIYKLHTWCLITTLLSSFCSFSLEPILMFSFSISPLERSTT